MQVISRAKMIVDQEPAINKRDLVPNQIQEGSQASWWILNQKRNSQTRCSQLIQGHIKI